MTREIIRIVSSHSHSPVHSHSHAHSPTPKADSHCDACKGRGHYKNLVYELEPVRCNRCRGRCFDNLEAGSSRYHRGDKKMYCCHFDPHCRFCFGELGYYIQRPCYRCLGTGKQAIPRRIEKVVQCACFY